MTLRKSSLTHALVFMIVVGGIVCSAHAQFLPSSGRLQEAVQAAGADPSSMAGDTPALLGAELTQGRSIPAANGMGGLPSTTSTDELNRVLSRARGVVREDPPSQFQKFVQESTGVLLPIFGSQLFDAPQNYVPDAGLAAPANYILGPGDEVRLNMWGAVDIAASYTLDRDGKIVLPKVGAVSLHGVTAASLENVLKSHLGKVFTNFGLNASLGKLRSIQVYVVGQARQPGTYAVSSLSTLVNVLFVSGGPNSNGSMRGIELQRAGKVVTRIDLYDFIAKGDKSADVVVQPGDVIFIPPASKRVAITGAYDQTAIYELSEKGSTVGDILMLGGGASPIASSRKALLERVYADRVPPRQVLDLALDVKGFAQPLVGGDILTLLPVSPAFSNAVTLQGVVAEPQRYRWFEGMKVLDLIPDRDALITPAYHRRKNQLSLSEPGTAAPNMSAPIPVQNSTSVAQNGTLVATSIPPVNVKAAGPTGGGATSLDERVRTMVDQINWDYAVIERLSKDKLSTELIPFNLGKAILQKDPSQNISLQPGDVLTILGQKDLALPQERQSRLVRVEGEVAAPGIYQAQAGETLPQLLKRIGGLTAQAYVFGTEFSRESVRVRQQENLQLLVRKLEAQLQSDVRTVVASNTQEAAGSAALLQQQQAQLQSQISRLKSLKSNGRMTLELDPSARSLAALPALPLEDGDRIYVPSAPGYVVAVGAVNNENAMIYKPGKTVADIVRTAGTTDDAETDSIFVLRADGSVVTKKDSGGWFGGRFESMAMMPGDTLVVPAKVDRESGYAFTVRALKDWTQIIANLGIGAAAIKTLRD